MTPDAPPRERVFAGRGGIRLVADAWGEESSPPLVLLHAGGQTRHAWRRTGPRAATLGWRVVAPDLRGHGASAWSADGDYDLGLFADDVRALAAQVGDRPVLVGASLGGLSSLLAAGEAPAAAIRALVLVDVAHRPDPTGARRIVELMRRHSTGFTDVQEAAAAISPRSSHTPPRPRPRGDDDEGIRRYLRREGERWFWHWDPRLLDSFAGRMDPPGMADRLLDAACRADAPILLVRGGISDLVREDVAQEFCARVPRARCVEVAGAGHMVVGDRNEHFVEAIVPFLEEVG